MYCNKIGELNRLTKVGLDIIVLPFKIYISNKIHFYLLSTSIYNIHIIAREYMYNLVVNRMIDDNNFLIKCYYG